MFVHHPRPGVQARTPIVRALVAAVTATTLAGPATADGGDDGPPATMTLQAVVRDFHPYHHPLGHDDFQRFSGTPRIGMVQEVLGGDGKPILASRLGERILLPFTDTGGRPVRPEFVKDGTIPGTHGVLEPAESIHIWSDESFASWYRDVPGLNLSTVVPLTLVETEPGSGVFVFDSHDVDPAYNPRFHGLPLPGFFPINDQLLGNYEDFDHGSTNFHFTTEISTSFMYEAGSGQSFRFTGDDDVWVFVDGRLVIDLGGVHAVAEQSIQLDDLDWLVDGEAFTLHVFHAERRTAQSNFRIETTIDLSPFANVMVADAYD